MGLGIIISIIMVLGPIFFLLYALQNRENFGNYLLIAAILILISYVIRISSQYLFTPLFLSGVDVITIVQITLISSIIDLIIFIAAMAFLVYHGVKNEDISMIIAGILQIFLISISLVLSLLSSLAMINTIS